MVTYHELTLVEAPICIPSHQNHVEPFAAAVLYSKTESLGTYQNGNRLFVRLCCFNVRSRDKRPRLVLILVWSIKSDPDFLIVFVAL